MQWSVARRFHTVKHGILDDAPVLQVLDDDALEERGGHVRVPDAFGVHHDDRTTRADAEARGLATLDPRGPEQETLSLQQLRQFRVDRAAFSVRRTKPARAHEHVAGVGIQNWRGHE